MCRVHKPRGHQWCWQGNTAGPRFHKGSCSDALMHGRLERSAMSTCPLLFGQQAVGRSTSAAPRRERRLSSATACSRQRHANTSDKFSYAKYYAKAKGHFDARTDGSGTQPSTTQLLLSRLSSMVDRFGPSISCHCEAHITYPMQ